MIDQESPAVTPEVEEDASRADVEAARASVRSELAETPVAVVEEPKPTPVEIDFRFSDAKRLMQIFNAVGVLVDEVTLKLTYEKLQLKMMDPSHVAMITLDMPRTMFTEYHVPSPVDLCFNLDELKKLFGGRLKADDDVTFRYKTEQTRNELAITLRSRNVRNYKLLALEPSKEELPSPKISFKAERRIVTANLVDILKDCDKVSDHAVFVFEKDRDFTVRAGGDSGSLEEKMNDEDVLAGHTNEPSRAAFSLTYLKDMVDALSKVGDTMLVELSTDMPIRFTLNMPIDGVLSYYLAPRIESAQ